MRTFGLILLVVITGRFATAQLPPSAPLDLRAASVLVIGGSMMNGAQFAESTLPAMREHFAGCRQVALILHASHPSERDAMERRLAAAFLHLNGAEARSLHHGTAAEAAEALRSADGIFVGGGETFVLLRELYRSGQIAIIRERVSEGVPYAGSSAGANVAGIRIGTTNDFPVADIPSRESLAIFPAVINPHHPFASTEAEYAARAGKIRTYLKFNPAESVLGLANASIARLHEGTVSLRAGQGWLYRADSLEELVVGESAELAFPVSDVQSKLLAVPN